MIKSSDNSRPVSRVSRPQRGQTVGLAITGLAFGGQGLGRLNDFVIFVPGGFPGDHVRARIARVKRRHAEAVLEGVITPSSYRREPACRHYGKCGGCRWQALDYQTQLHYKEQQVRDCLERLGGLSGFDMRPIRGMEHPWRYRNKVEFSIGPSVVAAGPGPAAVGFHPLGRWDLVMPLEECHLVPRATQAVRAAVESWVNESGCTPWDARAQRGEARHLAVREAHSTGEILVTLVTSSPDPPALDRLVELLLREHPSVVGVIHSVNSGRAEVVGGLPSRLLWGRPFLREVLAGLELKVSSEAFLQTNTIMAETLYGLIAEEAHLSGGEGVWDLYSGIGSISLHLARFCRSVLGVEVVPAAVTDAEQNAALNGIESAIFLPGNTRVVLKDILQGKQRLPAGLESPDLVVVDPPRGGLANKVVARISAAGPDRVVYVSCNPATMAPNLALFAEHGYRLRRVTPVDMFPHTPHVEAVGVIERS